ncbi:MAG TPA: L-rhamnose mutarotase [Victivallales bacterium]|nr:L-rhamnose mutarotase [Victivallales bacterium]HPO89936.1 L-rhamnose mutarotase [Victivallales bacterium]HRR28681.1 L-rhamnose mutarotase [Victivallales bacterium]HRU01634.1 L-rhamnose mutarotase [Victivallales bacterium]
MIRLAHIFKLKKDSKEEYIKRHNPIWKELEKTLKDHGVHNYSIFLNDKTNELFAYVEVEDIERWNSIANTEICKKWWEYMKDLMECNPDNSPKAKKLTEVFHID